MLRFVRYYKPEFGLSASKIYGIKKAAAGANPIFAEFSGLQNPVMAGRVLALRAKVDFYCL
jgi:hypothetical protein